MEAVPATSGVRPTVRLAAGLVIGQVLLVAVVGWLTFTHAGRHPGGRPPTVDQLAAPPAVMPPPVVPPPVVPAPSRSATPGRPPSRSTSHPGRRRTADPDLPAATRSSSNPSPPAFGAHSSAVVVPPAPPTVTPPLSLLPTSDSPAAASPAPSTSSTPPPVAAGLPCTEIFVLAPAADGSTVRCLPARNGQLRWKIV